MTLNHEKIGLNEMKHRRNYCKKS